MKSTGYTKVKEYAPYNESFMQYLLDIDNKDTDMTAYAEWISMKHVEADEYLHTQH